MERKTFKFKISTDATIQELNQELENYKKLKMKFTKEKGKYTKAEADKFLDNFYNAKLNTIISMTDYYVRNKELKKSNNPFNEINGDELITYQVKMCDALADLDLIKISSDDSITNIYYDISVKIKEYVDKERDFVRDIELLKEIIIFYRQYMLLK